MPTRPLLRPVFSALLIAASLFWLSACGGGGKIEDLFNSLWIYSVDAPSQVNQNAEVTVTARASISGDIDDQDLNWDWYQTSGSAVINPSVERVGSSSIYRFRAPANAGYIDFRVRVEAKGLVDNENFSIYVRN